MKDFRFDDEMGEVRLCDDPECQETGEFRAPKSRDDLRTYFWFCLRHVREYNRTWNYFQGMSQAEIEAYQHSSNTWHRPTWTIGGNGGPERHESFRFEHLQDDLGLFGAAQTQRAGGAAAPAEPGIRGPIRKALATLELTSMASATEVKLRYKELAKRFHPDLNGGDTRDEERLKEINAAYSYLSAAGYA